MKCDELKPLVFSLKDFAYIDESAAKKNFENPHDHAVYKATEVDAAIAELKNKIEDAKATAYAESVDAGMRERRLKRAIYKACTNWANCENRINGKDAYVASGLSNPRAEEKFCKKTKLWGKMKDKCLKKAEEYK